MIWQKNHKKINRRTPVEREGRQWWKSAWIMRGGLVAIGAGIMVTAMVILSDPQTMPLRTVQVESEFHHVSADQVRQAVASYAWQGFLKIDIDTIKTDLLAKPWIASVEIERVWPDELYVKITEHKAVARWEDGGLLDEAGAHFFPEENTFSEDVVMFSGNLDHAVEMTQYYMNNKTTISQLGLDITQVKLDERHAWHLTLSNNMALILGRTESEQRLQRFVRWYPQLEGGAVKRVDLRYSNGFSIQWLEQTEEAAKS